MSTRNGGRYASKTVFDALAVEEIQSEPESEPEVSDEPVAVPETPSPPVTRSAKKKANKASPSTKQAKSANKAQEAAKAANDVEASPNGSARETNGVKEDAPAPTRVSEPVAPSPVATPVANAAPVTPAPKDDVSVAQKEPESTTPAAPKIDGVKAPEPVVKIADKVVDQVKAAKAAVQNDDEAAAEARRAKWKKIWERTLFTFLMIGGFLGECRNCQFAATAEPSAMRSFN